MHRTQQIRAQERAIAREICSSTSDKSSAYKTCPIQMDWASYYVALAGKIASSHLLSLISGHTAHPFMQQMRLKQMATHK